MERNPFIFMIGSLLVLAGLLGYFILDDSYKDGKIFPPKLPSNVSDINSWPTKEVWRLSESLNCSDLPIFKEDVPVNMTKMFDTCQYINNVWAQKFRNEKLSSIKIPDELK